MKKIKKFLGSVQSLIPNLNIDKMDFIGKSLTVKGSIDDESNNVLINIEMTLKENLNEGHSIYSPSPRAPKLNFSKNDKKTNQVFDAPFDPNKNKPITKEPF